jgi:hypothetical protein
MSLNGDQPTAYQDVVWGSGLPEAPVTDAPVTFKRFQLVMNSAAFFLCKLDHGSCICHWENTKTETMITTLMPDFRAVGYDELVYDMTYVLDLLPKLAGRGTPDEGHNLVATLRSHSNKPY